MVRRVWFFEAPHAGHHQRQSSSSILHCVGARSIFSTVLGVGVGSDVAHSLRSILSQSFGSSDEKTIAVLFPDNSSALTTADSACPALSQSYKVFRCPSPVSSKHSSHFLSS